MTARWHTGAHRWWPIALTLGTLKGEAEDCPLLGLIARSSPADDKLPAVSCYCAYEVLCEVIMHAYLTFKDGCAIL